MQKKYSHPPDKNHMEMIQLSHVSITYDFYKCIS